MPRIYTSTSDPIDFCQRCFPDEDSAEAKYASVGDGPDGRGNCFEYQADHPPYDDDEGSYRCEVCKKKLSQFDD